MAILLWGHRMVSVAAYDEEYVSIQVHYKPNEDYKCVQRYLFFITEYALNRGLLVR